MTKGETRVTKKDEIPSAPTSGAGSWTGAAAIAGAAIGSAAVAAALLYASRRKVRDKPNPSTLPTMPPPETD